MILNSFLCKKWLVIWTQPYFIAETTMPGKNGFDLNGASQSFNVLAEYLFGKVAKVVISVQSSSFKLIRSAIVY